MEAMKNHKPVIRAVPRESSRLFLPAAVLPVLFGIMGLFLHLAAALRLSEKSRGGMLPEIHVPAMAPTLLVAVIMILAGVLLFFAGKSRLRYLNVAAIAVLFVAVRQYYLGFGVAFFPAFAVLLLFLSAIGGQYNVVLRFLPNRLRVPVMNLLSAVLALISVPLVIEVCDVIIRAETAAMSPLVSYCTGIFVLLPVAGVFLTGLAVEPDIERRDAPKLCTKSIPQGGLLFTVAAAILLAGNAVDMGRILLSVYDMSAFFLRIPLVAAGVLLLVSNGREKRFFAAVICLLLGSFVLDAPMRLTIMSQYRSYAFSAYALALLLMLFSAIGMLWNVAPKLLSKFTRAPVLNILASVLLLLSMTANIVGVAKYDAAVKNVRDTAAVSIADDFGNAVAAANKAKEKADEAATAFYEADTAYKAALETAAEFLAEENLADIEQLNADVVASVAKDIEAMEYRIAGIVEKEMPTVISRFAEVSDEIVAAYEEAASGAPKRSTDSEPASGKTPPSTSPSSTPASAAPKTAPSVSSRPDYEAVDVPKTQKDSQNPEIDMDTAIDALNAASQSANMADRALTSAIEAAEDAFDDVFLKGYSAKKDIEKAVATAKEDFSVWYLVALSLLPAAGLVLLNVSLGNSQLEKRGAAATFLQFCRRIVRWFYRNVGGRLQLLAKIQGVCCLVLAGLSVLVAAYGLCGFLTSHFFVAAGESYPSMLIFTTTATNYVALLMYGGTGILASAILALPTWFLYSYGQITADIRELKEKDGFDAICAPENPDDLPEL